MKQLVFIHGRSQEHKDAKSLKAAWITAFQRGLDTIGAVMPIAEADIRFPYYGDTLADLVGGKSEQDAAPVIVRGDGADSLERAFLTEVFQEVLAAKGVTREQFAEVAGQGVVDRGPLNWEWVQDALRVLDRFISGGGSTSLAVFTHDVYRYLDGLGIRDAIESGVRQALTPGVPTVVVGHSLGTVVAYNLLKREGAAAGWRVPLLVTLGSPLAVNAIKRKLAPIAHPTCVTTWVNAMDERDVVPLYRLDGAHFRVTPEITNITNIKNHTKNRHGIEGYLDDEQVARLIHGALVS